MKSGHVLKIEGNEAILCQCGEGCKCDGLDTKDPTKCVCGNPVKRVSLEGTGILLLQLRRIMLLQYCLRKGREVQVWDGVEEELASGIGTSVMSTLKCRK